MENREVQKETQQSRETIELSEEQKEYLIKHAKNAFEVAKLITKKSTPIYLTGGTIRDLLLERAATYPDYDFVGDFDLDQIQRDYPSLVIGRWDEVSTIKLRIGSAIYDFTSTKNIEARLGENDITISNICLRDDGTIVDPVGGLESLNKREIKIVNASEKMKIDPGRILRVFRFAAELDFTIDESTLRAAIDNAHLLSQTRSYITDLWKILSLESEKRAIVLKSLHSYGIDRFLSYPEEATKQRFDVMLLEEEVSRRAPNREVAELFNSDVYLVGGALRDLIFGKRVKDFDYKVRLPLADMIAILKKAGYQETTNLHVTEGEYYVNQRAQSVSIFVNGVDVDISEMVTTDIPTLIRQGDVNFNCCVVNANTGKVENPDVVRQIQRKELTFCDARKAEADPLIIINALKQISRLPDILIPEETEQIIIRQIPHVVEYIRQHPELRYKISSLCGNLNSEEVYRFFDSTSGGQSIFDGMERKKPKLFVTSQRYASFTTNELKASDKAAIIHLLTTAYGKKFDPTKVFRENINSVVFEKSEDGRMNAACLLDGERLYSVAARGGHHWIKLIEDLVQSNYNLWATIDCNNPKIQALCSIGGLCMETDPRVMSKILQAKCNKREDDLDIYEQNGLLVFAKKNSDDYPQVLLRS